MQLSVQNNFMRIVLILFWFRHASWPGLRVLENLLLSCLKGQVIQTIFISIKSRSGKLQQRSMEALTSYTDLVKGPFHHSASTQNLRLGSCSLYVLQVLLPDLTIKQKYIFYMVRVKHILLWSFKYSNEATFNYTKTLQYLIPHFQDFLWVGVQWDKLIGYSSLAKAFFFSPL